MFLIRKVMYVKRKKHWRMQKNGSTFNSQLIRGFTTKYNYCF